DAMVADPEHSMLAVDATQRGAAGARLALVACAPGWIAEIIAPGPLQYIAAERRHVADLRAGSEIEGLGDDRVIVPYLRMLAGGGHRDESAEIEPVDATFDAGPRRVERIDVDQYLGPHHDELHQVEEGPCRRPGTAPPPSSAADGLCRGSPPPAPLRRDRWRAGRGRDAFVSSASRPWL